jgi:hypothetical protein
LAPARALQKVGSIKFNKNFSFRENQGEKTRQLPKQIFSRFRRNPNNKTQILRRGAALYCAFALPLRLSQSAETKNARSGLLTPENRLPRKSSGVSAFNN